MARLAFVVEAVGWRLAVTGIGDSASCLAGGEVVSGFLFWNSGLLHPVLRRVLGRSRDTSLAFAAPDVNTAGKKYRRVRDARRMMFRGSR